MFHTQKKYENYKLKQAQASLKSIIQFLRSIRCISQIDATNFSLHKTMSLTISQFHHVHVYK